jgi:Family of unknown function (DUF6174)
MLSTRSLLLLPLLLISAPLSSSGLAGGAELPSMPGAQPVSPIQGRPPQSQCVPGFVQPSPAALARDLAAAKKRWAASGIRAYSFDFDQIAQPVLFPKTRITVSASGAVSIVESVPGSASPYAASATVEKLFEFIQQGISYARREPCAELKVRYALEGYPLSYASELRLINIADGGGSFAVSRFVKR